MRLFLLGATGNSLLKAALAFAFEQKVPELMALRFRSARGILRRTRPGDKSGFTYALRTPLV